MSFLSVAFAVAVMFAGASVCKVVFEEGDILFGSQNRLDLCKEVVLTLFAVDASFVLVILLFAFIAGHRGTELVELCLLGLGEIEAFKRIGAYAVFAAAFLFVAIYVFVAYAFIIVSLVVGSKRSESHC